MSETPPVIGVDLGGTHMQIGVLDANDRLAGRAARKTGAADGLAAVLDGLVAGIDEACAAASLGRAAIGAIGVAAAGAIDVPNGVVLTAPNLGWTDVPLRDLLRERVDQPVLLDNDVNGAVWGEYRLGGAVVGNDVLGVWVGTGVGGGLVLGGRLHHGDRFTAGEIGHTVITPDGPPGARIVEDSCGRSGMHRVIARRLAEHPESVLTTMAGGDPMQLTTDDLKHAYDAGDELAVAVVDRAADLLGMAIANWVTVLALGSVIIGGGITETFGDPFVARIRSRFERDVFPDRCRQCPLVVTALASDAGLLGAALLARDGLR